MQIMNRILILAALLVFTGCITNVLILRSMSLKACGKTSAAYNEKCKEKKFLHTYVIALLRFFGKSLCLIAYFIYRCIRVRLVRDSREGQETVEPWLPWSQWTCMMPSGLTNVGAITMVYTGIRLASDSRFLLLKSSHILFTAVLLRVFLSQAIRKHQWLGIVAVSLGLAFSGSTNMLYSTETSTGASSLAAGCLLIVAGEVIASTTDVFEQRALRLYNIHPLFATGLEGAYSTLILMVMLYPMYYITFDAPGDKMNPLRMEDVWDALEMMKQNTELLLVLIAQIPASAVFHYIGMIIVKEQSSLTRVIINCCVDVSTWVYYLCNGFYKEDHIAAWLSLQIIGTVFIIFIGPCLYFNVVFLPLWRRFFPVEQMRSAQEDELIDEDFPYTDHSGSYVTAEDAGSNGHNNRTENNITERTRLLDNNA